ncbi:MAG: hypothetical protein L3J58_10400 [Emcibacter sp.]|nr:hypothetical protein [Emcibacter sp.]
MTNYETLQNKVKDENINSQTLLATDYINHFNEVHMLLDMLPSMPECIEDILEWSPKNYQEHFADSVFAAKDLAIEAYNHSPDEYRLPFEETIAKMDELVLSTIAQVSQYLEEDSREESQRIIDDYGPQMITLIEKCGAIINGEKHVAPKDSIDHYFDKDTDKLDGEDLSQNAIDDLFG